MLVFIKAIIILSLLGSVTIPIFKDLNYFYLPLMGILVILGIIVFLLLVGLIYSLYLKILMLFGIERIRARVSLK